MKAIRSYWAIETGREHLFERSGFVGVYWFNHLYKHTDFACCTIALFKTRKLAREQLPQVKGQHGFPKARVAKVQVTIEVMPERT